MSEALKYRFFFLSTSLNLPIYIAEVQTAYKHFFFFLWFSHNFYLNLISFIFDISFLFLIN